MSSENPTFIHAPHVVGVKSLLGSLTSLRMILTTQPQLNYPSNKNSNLLYTLHISSRACSNISNLQPTGFFTRAKVSLFDIHNSYHQQYQSRFSITWSEIQIVLDVASRYRSKLAITALSSRIRLSRYTIGRLCIITCPSVVVLWRIGKQRYKMQ